VTETQDDIEGGPSDISGHMGVVLGLPPKSDYTKADRYRDFRKVFMETPEGQRVLRELFEWGHMFRANIAARPIDPYLTHFLEGERNIALRVLNTLAKEPTDIPKQSKRSYD